MVDGDDPLVYSLIWLVVMHLFAAYTTWQRAREVPSVFLLSLLAYSASAAVTLGVLFGFRVYEFDGRTIVPLAGIVVGNSLSATVLVSRRLFDAGRERRTEIEGRLALGLSAADAFQPILRESLRTALIPQIETTKAVGIIALPGAMVGLILAGSRPRRRSAGADLGDVPRPRQRRHHDGGHESRNLAQDVHLERSADPTPLTTSATAMLI